MQVITSRANATVKYAVHLRESSAFRREEQAFLLEGMRLCRDAVRSGYAVAQAFFSEGALLRYPAQCEEIAQGAKSSCSISEALAKTMSDTGETQGVFCVCAMPKQAGGGEPQPGKHYLALERLQNPQNLGGILRTADALGLGGVLHSGGCDRYNPKVLRAAMGSALRVSAWEYADLPLALVNLRAKGLRCFAAVPAAGALDIRALPREGGCIIVIGNEGAGVTPEATAACDGAVTIPMAGGAESLNAAAAAAILAWELQR